MATTINSYSVSLSLNASEYVNGGKLARSEAAKLRREISSIRNPQEQFNNSFDLLEKALNKGAISLETYSRLLDKARQKKSQAIYAEQAHERAVLKNNLALIQQRAALLSNASAQTSQNSAMSAGIGIVKRLAVAYVGMKVAGVVKQSVQLSVAVEQASARFEVLTGSVENAANLMGRLRQAAAASPITFSGMQAAASTLLQFNVRASQVMPTIRTLSAVAGGNEERFKSLALAYGQMSAAGRLMGQDLLQMINAGFNPLQEISRKTGESMIELKQRMEDGAISSQEVASAFLSATEEGGLFFGMSDRLAETLGGKLAIATSQLEEAMTKLGDTMGPLIIDMLEGFENNKGLLNDVLYLVENVTDKLRLMLAVYKDLREFFTFEDTSKTLVEQLSSFDSNAAQVLVEIENRRLRREKEANKVLGDIVDADGGDTLAGALLSNGLDAAADKAQSLMESLIAGRKKLIEEAGKFEKDQMKAITAQAKREDAARRSLSENALSNARKHFEEERRRQMKMTADMTSMMSGAGAEIGSGEDVRFNAQSINRAIADSIAQPQPLPTDEQLLDEAQKQLQVLQQQKQGQDKMVDTLSKILEEQKTNGFKRIR